LYSVRSHYSSSSSVISIKKFEENLSINGNSRKNSRSRNNTESLFVEDGKSPSFFLEDGKNSEKENKNEDNIFNDVEISIIKNDSGAFQENGLDIKYTG
jgi:hypothetical protein